MIQYNLIIRRMINKLTPLASTPLVRVSVIQDKWTYDTGREIEFIGMGLPKQFVFVALSSDNSAYPEGQANGDARSGSWSGYATQIGPNRYQAVQPTGLESEPTGVAVFGDYNSNPFSVNGTTLSSFGQTAASPMGINTDWALARSQCSDVVFGDIGNRINRPKWGSPAILPTRFFMLAYGDAFDKNTRSIQAGASVVRRGMYNFDGTIVSTNFYPRENIYSIGGSTFMPVDTLVDSTDIRNIYRETSQPITTAGLAETKAGNGRVATSKLYVLVYTETVSPYKTWEMRLIVNDNGSLSYERRGSSTPGQNGYNTASEAFALFTSNPDDVLDNVENRQTLRQMYFSALTRELGHEIHYPISIPHNFRMYTGTTEMANGQVGWQLTDSWITSADFINKDYTIGG